MLDTNKIYNMDCFEGMKLINDKSIDLILSDPPYGELDLEWDKKPDLNKLFKEYNRIIKDDGNIVLTASTRFAVDLINANKEYFRYDWVWYKTAPVNFLNAKKMPLRNHELILVFYKNHGTYNPQGLIKLEQEKRSKGNIAKDGAYKNYNKCYTSTHTNYPKSILKFKKGSNGTLHPTQKPIDLFRYLILTYSNKNDIVLDNYMGSGTTAISAISADRKYIGFELSEKYYKIASERIELFENHKNGNK